MRRNDKACNNNFEKAYNHQRQFDITSFKKTGLTIDNRPGVKKAFEM
jgi:hypothetical protein